jgi:hypothetical protein
VSALEGPTVGLLVIVDFESVRWNLDQSFFGFRSAPCEVYCGCLMQVEAEGDGSSETPRWRHFGSPINR